MQFKVGDRVRSNQPGYEYTGTITRIGDSTATVKRDGEGTSDGWSCTVVGDKIGTAFGSWDKKSYLTSFNGKQPAVKFVVIYDEVDRDPAEYFNSQKELDEWLKKAQTDRDIIWSSIRIFKVAWEKRARCEFVLEEVK